MPFRRSRFGAYPPLPSSKVDWTDPLATGLIHAWPLTDGGGLYGRNLIAKGADMALTATPPTWTSWKRSGKQLSFNGSNNALSVALNLTSYNKLSVSFWGVNTTNGSGDNMFMEFTPNMFGATLGGFMIDPYSGGFPGTVEMACKSTLAAGIFVDVTFPQPTAAVWNHWAVVYDYTISGVGKIVAVYINGIAQTLTTRFGTDTTTTGTFANSTLYVMSRGAASLWNTGYMQDIRMWSRTLTQSEVWQLYSTPWRPFAPQKIGLPRAPASSFFPRVVRWRNA